jgi:hypothetical protein
MSSIPGTMCGALPFFIVLLLVACTPTITRKEYDQRCNDAVNLHNTLTGHVYYQGSRNGYDYFLFEPFAALSHQARVKEGEVALKKRIPYDRNRDHWIVTDPDRSWTTHTSIQTDETNR